MSAKYPLFVLLNLHSRNLQPDNSWLVAIFDVAIFTV